MDAKQITRELKESGSPVHVLANKLLVTPSAVSQVIHEIRKTPRIQEAIASAIGRSVDEVWPPEKEAA